MYGSMDGKIDLDCVSGDETGGSITRLMQEALLQYPSAGHPMESIDDQSIQMTTCPCMRLWNGAGCLLEVEV